MSNLDPIFTSPRFSSPALGGSLIAATRIRSIRHMDTVGSQFTMDGHKSKAGLPQPLREANLHRLGLAILVHRNERLINLIGDLLVEELLERLALNAANNKHTRKKGRLDLLRLLIPVPVDLGQTACDREAEGVVGAVLVPLRCVSSSSCYLLSCFLP
jgi:hypothetical protein